MVVVAAAGVMTELYIVYIKDEKEDDLRDRADVREKQLQEGRRDRETRRRLQ